MAGQRLVLSFYNLPALMAAYYFGRRRAVETAVRERRKYEQDELLFESAEIARLRAKAETLKASGEIAKAPALR